MAGGDQLKVVGISGSLRKASYNTAALHAAVQLGRPALAITPFDLRAMPLYDEDVKQAGFPAPAEALREAVRSSDGVLIVTPEYNYSFSGVLKNAIDWVSRPPDQPFQDKPIAIMSASPGALGGARAQYHLRQCFVYLEGRVMSQPEVMIANAPGRFEAGELTDLPTLQLLGKFLAGFAAWIRRIEGSRAA